VAMRQGDAVKIAEEKHRISNLETSEFI